MFKHYLTFFCSKLVVENVQMTLNELKSMGLWTFSIYLYIKESIYIKMRAYNDIVEIVAVC